MNFGIYNPHRVIVAPIADNKIISNFRSQLSVGLAQSVVSEALNSLKNREIQIWNDCELTTVLLRVGGDCSALNKTLALIPKHLYIVNSLAKISAFVEIVGIFNNSSEEIPFLDITLSSPVTA